MCCAGFCVFPPQHEPDVRTIGTGNASGTQGVHGASTPRCNAMWPHAHADALYQVQLSTQ